MSLSDSTQSVAYFIATTLDTPLLERICQQLQSDLSQQHRITQCFFYGDAVHIGALSEYATALNTLIDCCEDHEIALYLCSAAFQVRQLTLSEIGQQDFQFKGLGQFIAALSNTDALRTFLPTPAPASPPPLVHSDLIGHCIDLSNVSDLRHLKECLDVALVSVSYDVKTAVYIPTTVIEELQQSPDPTLIQSVNMLVEFNATLYSDKSQTLFHHACQAKDRPTLLSGYRHVFCFG